MSSRLRLGALLFGIAGVLVAATVAGASSPRPIKVGMLVPLSGPSAQNGLNEARGFNLAGKIYGSRIDGHQIELKYVDTQGNPAIALAQARALVENDHVDVIEGPLFGGEVDPVSAYLAPLGEPTDDVQLCSGLQYDLYQKYDYGFASGWTCEQPSLMGAVWAAKVKHWKKIVIVGQDYTFGWENAGAFATVFRKLGGTIEKFVWIPPFATDFSPYMPQIPTDADAVFVEMAGLESVRFTQAYLDFGLHSKMPLFGNTTLTDQSALPSENPAAVTGAYVAATYCDGINSKLNNLFAKRYYAAYGTYPANGSEFGFTKAHLLINAMKKLHGDASNHKAVIDAMKSTAIIAPRGPVKLSPKTLSPIQNVYICQVKRVNGVLRNVPIFTYKAVQPWGPLAESVWEAHFRHDATARPS